MALTIFGRTIRKIGVIGSGNIGPDIALHFSQNLYSYGVPVVVVDILQAALDAGSKKAESKMAKAAEKGIFKKNEADAIFKNMLFTTDYGKLSDADFVIEAIPEVPSLKKKVFAQLDKLCAGDTVLASNTSALDIFNLADVKQPERVVISHFFAPASIIPLVEIVPGDQTSPETVSFTANLMEKVGKSPVVMKRFGPGFIVNRIQKAIAEAALEMVEQGLAAPEEIDRAIKLSLGIRLPVVGVLQSLDFNGLDMVLDTMRNYGKIYSFVEAKVKAGHLGAKTSRGIYDYQGRNETQILRKRDEVYLKVLDYLQKIDAFDPV